MVREPARPPTPRKMNFWFQLAGSMISKFAEPGSAPSPEVATEPFTSQYSGLGAAAGTTVADVIVMLETPRALRADVLQSAADAGIFANAAQSERCKSKPQNERVKPPENFRPNFHVRPSRAAIVVRE